VFVQLLGGDPEPMAETARIAEAAGAPGIDLNFGCPAKVVNNHDGGAAILRCPLRVEHITRAVRDAVAIPVTVKIRVGWEDPHEVVDIARAAEAGGAAWLTIHGRTRAQGYRPPVHWDAIGRAREVTAIPVVANGDLNTVDDVRRCRRVSGCDAFMLGRGTMGRPDIFGLLRGQMEAPLPVGALPPVLHEYVRRLLDADAPPRAALGRLKQWLRLAAHVRGELRPLFDGVKVCQELEDGLRVLARLTRALAGTPANTDREPRPAHPHAP
jgi:tRNA-dihydrouridine synthase C